MRLIESKAELMLQPAGLEGVYKQIELCGRTCYKSEDKITEESAKPFVERMIASKHLAMLEHGTVYLAMPVETVIPIEANGWGKYRNKYSKTGIVCEVDGERRVAVTTNMRVLVENNWLDDLNYFCEPTEFHERRYTFKFTCDRGVSHELVRHRVFSFAQESTRYCNYSKDKFSKQITFIKPSWYKEEEEPSVLFYEAVKNAEILYFYMLSSGATPQEARQVLPNALKTEICMTGFASDWRYFFDLRLFGKTGAPHPDMLVLANKAKEAAEEAGIWESIMSCKSKFDKL